jgi:hypothetical protein
MIRLRFTGVTHPYGVFIGPAPWFRIVGGAILRGPGGETVARMHDQRWQVRGSIFNRFDCRQPLTIEMEGAEGESGESAGQFDECAVVGGTIFGEGAPIATWVADRGLWVSAETEEAWPALLIQTAQVRPGFPVRFSRGGP